MAKKEEPKCLIHCPNPHEEDHRVMVHFTIRVVGLENLLVFEEDRDFRGDTNRRTMSTIMSRGELDVI